MVKFRSLMLAAIILAVCVAPVAAQNLVNNGGFETGLTGWTAWTGGWGSGYTAAANSSAAYSGSAGLRLGITGEVSFGVYQQISVTAGKSYNLDGMWRGFSATGNWFEILLIDGTFNTTQADNGDYCFNNVICGYDVHGAFQYPAPANFGWQSFSSIYDHEVSPYITNGTRVASGNTMTVVLKMGSVGNSYKPTLFVDNVTLTQVPEPASLLALMTGVIGMVSFARRKK